MESSIAKTILPTLTEKEVEEADDTIVTHLVEELDSMMKNHRLKVWLRSNYSPPSDTMNLEIWMEIFKKPSTDCMVEKFQKSVR